MCALELKGKDMSGQGGEKGENGWSVCVVVGVEDVRFDVWKSVNVSVTVTPHLSSPLPSLVLDRVNSCQESPT